MATLTAASEIQAKLNAAIAALLPSHRHLYINTLMSIVTGQRPEMPPEELPEPVQEALGMYGALAMAHKIEHFQIEEKQRQESPVVATATELLKSLIAANPGTDPKNLAAQALAAARKLHDREG
jgi:hypothetical protein